MNTLSYYAKCITAAIVTGYGTYQVAMADGVITQAEWVQIVLAILASLSVVWGVPNALAKTPASAPMSVTPPVQPATIFEPPAVMQPVVPAVTPSVVTAPADLSASVQAGL
jgi:hypothetical protein